MKLMKILLVLVVLSVMTTMASADDHNFHGTDDGTGTSGGATVFVFDGTVTDESYKYLDGTKMSFQWIDPEGGPRRFADVYSFDDELFVVDTLVGTDHTGTWTVQSIEYAPIGVPWKITSGTFEVGTVPEFFFGTFVALLFVGLMYFAMRRNLAGSFNAN